MEKKIDNYLVDSQNNIYLIPGGKIRLVSIHDNMVECSCPAKVKCKHVIALEKKGIINVAKEYKGKDY